MNDSNAPVLDDVDRDRRALAWWSDPALYGPAVPRATGKGAMPCCIRRRGRRQSRIVRCAEEPGWTVAMANPGSRSLRREGHD